MIERLHYGLLEVIKSNVLLDGMAASTTDKYTVQMCAMVRWWKYGSHDTLAPYYELRVEGIRDSYFRSHHIQDIQDAINNYEVWG